MPTADQIAQKWLAAMQSGTAKQNYIDGVERQTVSPTVLAAEDDAEQRYLANVQESVTSGRRKQALLAYTLQQWKTQATTKGAPRLASGAASSVAKMRAFVQKFQPVWEQIRAEVKESPKGTIEDAVNRVRLVITRLKEAAGKPII